MRGRGTRLGHAPATEATYLSNDEGVFILRLRLLFSGWRGLRRIREGYGVSTGWQCTSIGRSNV
eukprot:scaffold277731_cov30-Tisochrysis_lutea.AAC.9